MMCGPGGFGGGLGLLVPLALTVWFVVFSVIVLQKLDKLIELLGKK